LYEKKQEKVICNSPPRAQIIFAFPCLSEGLCRYTSGRRSDLRVTPAASQHPRHSDRRLLNDGDRPRSKPAVRERGHRGDDECRSGEKWEGRRRIQAQGSGECPLQEGRLCRRCGEIQSRYAPISTRAIRLMNSGMDNPREAPSSPRYRSLLTLEMRFTSPTEQ
jgi:hypothetical protein